MGGGRCQDPPRFWYGGRPASRATVARMDARAGFQAVGGKAGRPPIAIGRLREAELADADTLFRVAFGTFVGLPEPSGFMAGAELVRHRWHANRDACYAARSGDELVGVNFASRWGSVGFFGPLAVRPDWWGRGVAKRLLEASLPAFEDWRCRHVGLFTFPHSAMHLALYQKFGFRPRALTAVLGKAIEAVSAPPGASSLREGKAGSRDELRLAAAQITDALYPGLDLSSEMSTVLDRESGDVLVVGEASRPAGFAVCHCGAGSEAEAGACYVKFAAVRPGASRLADFQALLSACEAFAARAGARRLVAGVSTARTAAYEALLSRGYRVEILGVTMHRPNEAAYSTADAFVLDDWR